MSPTHLLTADEVARSLRVSRRTVYQLVQRDGLPAMRVGRHYRFRAESVEQWTKDQQKAETDSWAPRTHRR